MQIRRSVPCLALAFVLSALPAAAQKEKTATEFYGAYRAAWAKAKSFQDIAPWHSKASQAELKKIPADQQKMMFDMTREMDPKDVKVVKETATATGATLELAGTGPDKKPVKGTAQIVKEDGLWKLVKENWEM